MEYSQAFSRNKNITQFKHFIRFFWYIIRYSLNLLQSKHIFSNKADADCDITKAD